ncbi:hypothetical protein IAD21_06289 [Abditibacteriota bacterium]|nr:hypothetical protein IAD21_06289 [Abditibacteriota bacterium]
MRLSLEKQRFTAVALLLLWCIVLITYRIHLAYDWLAVGLLWNLFLATLPLLWSSAFRSAVERNRTIQAGLFFFLGLLFFPNAPYLLTDLIHLGPRPYVPLWYLMAMLLSCAGAGTLLGYLSLISVHTAIEQKWGKSTGWAVVTSSLMLCGFGIYLGRFLRVNSWDAFIHPLRLMKSMAGQFIDAGPHPHPLPVTLVFGIGLIIGYIGVRVLATVTSTK